MKSDKNIAPEPLYYVAGGSAEIIRAERIDSKLLLLTFSVRGNEWRSVYRKVE